MEDETLLKILDSCQEYQNFQERVSNLLARGYFSIAKARYKAGNVHSVQNMRFQLNPTFTIDSPTQQAELFADLLIEHGIKVVAFDMDQCLVAQHSRGSLQRKHLSDYTSKVTVDFLVAVTTFARRGLFLAVATHSDAAEYNENRSESEYIIGNELVERVLETAVPELKALFHVVAYNPTARKDDKYENRGKKKHIREIAARYNVEMSKVILFDDDIRNIETADGKFFAVQVDEEQGFKLKKAIEEFSINYSSSSSSSSSNSSSSNSSSSSSSSVFKCRHVGIPSRKKTVHGTWYMVHGTWYMVHGTRYMVHA